MQSTSIVEVQSALRQTPLNVEVKIRGETSSQSQVPNSSLYRASPRPQSILGGLRAPVSAMKSLMDLIMRYDPGEYFEWMGSYPK